MAFTTINKSSEYFNTKLFTGDGATSNAITGVGFQPDFVWLKNRSAVAGHQLSDAVRGKSGTNYYSLSSDTTAAQAVQGDNDGLNTLGSDGFTVGYTNSTGWNNSGNNYASWNWKANGTGSSNTVGSINSTVSANTTSGFSIVTFTGTGSAATVGHGLGAIPKMIILKSYGGSTNWIVYHNSIGNGKALSLNTTAGESADAGYFNSTTPTSTVFSLGSDGFSNGSGQTMVAYCFADVQGFSKMGSYKGNGSADGTFVYTGFKPAFVMTKEWEGTSDWYMNDTTRDPFNGTYGNDASLLANTSGAEFTSASLNVDMLSNGFKLRSTNASTNEVAGYIYMVFAAAPLVGSNNVPANAR